MTIVINTDKEVTPLKYAKLKGVTKQVVNNWIKRGKIKSRYIEEIELRLVPVEQESIAPTTTNCQHFNTESFRLDTWCKDCGETL